MDDWTSWSRHEWTVLTLPDRHWKWRMRHASISFAEQVNDILSTESRLPWDAVFATDMMNVAEFRGLVDPRVRSLPLTIYFHENQFAYPNQSEHTRDFHFAFTNLASAIAADQVWFNSRFNLESMSKGVSDAMKKWPDYLPVDAWDRVIQRAQVQHPGIGVAIDRFRRNKSRLGDPLKIVWAARWEHDKGPDLLREIVGGLAFAGVDFSISVIGQQFRARPSAFDMMQEEFADRIDQWGFLSNRQDYWNALASADLFLSTANHEFFGLSVAEAICLGTRPLLPNRLAYPELISMGQPEDPAVYLYDGSAEDAVKKVASIEQDRRRKVPDRGATEREAMGQAASEKAFYANFRTNLEIQHRSQVMDDAIEDALV